MKGGVRFLNELQNFIHTLLVAIIILEKVNLDVHGRWSWNLSKQQKEESWSLILRTSSISIHPKQKPPREREKITSIMSSTASTESTALLDSSIGGNAPNTMNSSKDNATDNQAGNDNANVFLRFSTPTKVCAIMLMALVVGVTIAGKLRKNGEDVLLLSSSSAVDTKFPTDFIWGSATSSYQVEGAANEDGRGLSIWDTYCDGKVGDTAHIVDGSSGDVACNHYHLFRDDIQLMKALNLKAYRFSISWTRIHPNGTGSINQMGIDFYNALIDELIVNDIEPWITLYHWDLPQTLQDQYGGWQDPQIIEDFAQYAQSCFEAFGDRVSNWITINEAWTVAVQAYEDGSKAPGIVDNPTIDVYRAGHHLILAHARAAQIYKQQYQSKSSQGKGQIGIANCGDYRYPLDSNSQNDVDAAERAMVFQYAWFTDPFFIGDYPEQMKDNVGERLPKFTKEERKLLIGSIDFLGLNHYSTLYASTPEIKSEWGGYWTDMDVTFSSDPSWRKNYMGWSTNPNGCRELLLWITQRYGSNTRIVITENGTSENEPDLAASLKDEGRREYMEGYIRACRQAIVLGANLVGYFAWSLMDNFEWEYGYTRRFGICHVDFETQERTPKSSALFYKETIESNGGNIIIDESFEERQ